MTITLAFLAVLMAAVLWWLFRQTVNVQPWTAAAATVDTYGSLPTPPAKTALWVFLAVATSLFGLFISAYAMRITLLDWTPLPQPRLLTFNTAILILASCAMEWSVFSARRRNLAQVRSGLAAGGGLALAFLVGQSIVWKQLADAGFMDPGNAATAFFYLLTAVHALHVLGGLLAWVLVVRRAWATGTEVPRLSVEMCAIYWHFLLIAWVVLFAVLVGGFFGLSICSPTMSL